MSNDLQEVIDRVETLLAVEKLEYHDSNWLAGDNAIRSRNKQSELDYIMNRLKEIKHNSLIPKHP